MTLHDIVQQWLAANGCNGLYHADSDCACKLDDLWPCGYPNGDCRPGVLVECPGEGCPGLGVLGHFHIGSRDSSPLTKDELVRRQKVLDDYNQDSVISEYDELSKQLAAANELLSSIRQENRRLAERVAAANEQIAALTEMALRHGLTPQSSKSPLGYLSSLITEQTREIEQLRSENRKLALAVASQTMRIAELERQPEALTRQNGELHD